MAEPQLDGPISNALLATVRWLKSMSLPFAVIGGVASGLVSRPRVTKDIDVTVLLNEDRLQEFALSGAEFGLAPRRDDWLALARAVRVIMLRHLPTGVDIDLGMAAQEFDFQLIENAKLIDLGGVPVPVAQPTDLLVMKAIAHRPKDVYHISDLLEVAWDEIDFDRARQWVAMAADAYEEPALLTDFDRTVGDERIAQEERKRASDDKSR